MDSRRASNRGMAQLAQKVSETSLSSKNGCRNVAARQWGSQSSAPKACGQPDTTQQIGTQGSSGSGQVPGNTRRNTGPYSGAMGRGGNQHGWSWADRVGSAAQKDEMEEDDVPDVATSEENDDEEDTFSDEEDDDLHDDGFEFDENPCSHESRKNKRMFRVFFERLDKLTMEEINDNLIEWHCPACHGSRGAIDRYRGLQPLTTHAKTKGNKRVKLHRLFAEVLEEELRRRGTSLPPAGESFGNWEGLRAETKDHKIVWPPMVQIMNTRLEKGDDEKWLGMGNQELLDYFSSYAVVKPRHSYGPQGHRGISVLIFENSAVGYLEAERLHKHFVDEGTDRQAWEQRRWVFNHGGKRQLFGCLATKHDLDEFNQHCQGKHRLKYELRSYNEMVVSQMRQMSEDNQQLTWFKEKAAKEQRHSKALEESLNFMSEKLRKTADENRIVKQRSTMHHQQNQEELDFQDSFFREQMKQVEECINVKENKFEKVQQDERKKVEELPLHASSAEERKSRREEVEAFVKSQDREISEFVLKRDEREKLHEERKDALRKRFQEEMLTLEKGFDADLTKLMEMYTPGSTQGDA